MSIVSAPCPDGAASAPRADGRLACSDSASWARLLTSPAAPPPTPAPLLRGQRFACTLPGVLSAAECQALVAATEARGYVRALLNVGGGREELRPDVRDSMRCMVDSPELADALLARLRHALPPAIHGLELAGLNERLRFLRYDPGQAFAAHRDGSFQRARGGPLAGERTLVTVLLYLNAGYEGCRTTFYCDEGLEGLVPAEGTAVEPAPGLALLHDHNLLHAAPALAAGRKYVLRTDVLYRQPQ